LLQSKLTNLIYLNKLGFGVMEELYLLLAERISQVEEIKYQKNKLTKLTSLDDIVNPKAFSNNKSHETNQFNKQLNLMKKKEKKRIIKENELIELVYNIKAFDLHQRQ